MIGILCIFNSMSLYQRQIILVLLIIAFYQKSFCYRQGGGGVGVSAWTIGGNSCLAVRRRTRIHPDVTTTTRTTLLGSSNSYDNNNNDETTNEAVRFKERAEQLRKEIDDFERQKKAAMDAVSQERYQEQVILEERKERYSAIVPILKPDGTILEERCDFTPTYQQDGSSYITTGEASLPLGLILGESAEFSGRIVVDEVADGSNGQLAGIRPGDVIRACTACRMEMITPTWQLLAGGIGQPKTVRFMYSVDNRPFEEVLEAIGSNRMDPSNRDTLLVIERREDSE
jgi:hypothetical protein